MVCALSRGRRYLGLGKHDEEGRHRSSGRFAARRFLGHGMREIRRRLGPFCRYPVNVFYIDIIEVRERVDTSRVRRHRHHRINLYYHHLPLPLPRRSRRRGYLLPCFCVFVQCLRRQKLLPLRHEPVGLHYLNQRGDRTCFLLDAREMPVEKLQCPRGRILISFDLSVGWN